MTPRPILLFLALFLLFSGCTGEEKKTQAPPEAATTLDSRGGVLRVSDPESPLFGAAVSIPENQLVSPARIQIRQSSFPLPLPTPLRAAGPVVDFGPDGLVFASPAELTLPYQEKDQNNESVLDHQVGVRHFDPISRQWIPMPVKKRDTQNRTVSFESRHFSVYIAAVTPVNETPSSPPETFTAGEYFLGNPEFRLENGQYILIEKGKIGRPGLPGGNPFHLLARFHPTDGLILGVDQLPSLNDAGGYRARFTEDGTGAILDTFPVFDKIAASGDARYWRWEAEFVSEFTRLNHYAPVDEQDPYAPEVPEDQRIYAKIQALNEREILLSWGIDLPAEMERGNTLCIAFEATYLGTPAGGSP